MSLCQEFDANSASSMGMRMRRRRPQTSALLILLAIHGSSAFIPTSTRPACSSLNKNANAGTTRLCATKEPASNQLFEIDDDGDTDDANFEQASFEDIDIDYDVDYDDDDLYYKPNPAAAAASGGLMADVDSWNDYQRDEDDILTEREDRLLLEDKPRKGCILVGVEDLSAKRRAVQAARNAGRELSPEEDQTYFTLEESMTEMRELIKTSGMELVGEITQRLNEPNPKTYVVSFELKYCAEAQILT